jgi:hypothetical protein
MKSIKYIVLVLSLGVSMNACKTFMLMLRILIIFLLKLVALCYFL